VPEPKRVIPASQPVELLDLVDPARHAVRGNWRFAGKDLVLDPMLHARLALPVQPHGSFELEVDFTKTGGENGVSVIMPVGSGSVAFLPGGMHGRQNLLCTVWWKQINANATPQSAHLLNHHRYKLLVRVRLLDDENARIEAELDGVPCIRPWEGLQAALLAPSWGRLPAGATLGIGGHGGQLTFHSVKLRMLDGEARVVSFDPAHWNDPWPHVDEP
jgi:hypothetical protein